MLSQQILYPLSHFPGPLKQGRHSLHEASACGGHVYFLYRTVLLETAESASEWCIHSGHHTSRHCHPSTYKQEPQSGMLQSEPVWERACSHSCAEPFLCPLQRSDQCLRHYSTTGSSLFLISLSFYLLSKKGPTPSLTVTICCQKASPKACMATKARFL